MENCELVAVAPLIGLSSQRRTWCRPSAAQAARMRCSTTADTGPRLHQATLAHLSRLQLKLRLDEHQ